MMNINSVKTPVKSTSNNAINEKAGTTPSLTGEIHEVSASMMLQHITRLQTNISHWLDAIHSDWDESWKSRFENTERMLELFTALMNHAQAPGNFSAANELHFAHFVDNEPVGLLTMFNHSEENTAYINCMVTHPGSTGAGASLIEKAVNQSEMWNYHGKVALDTIIGPTAQAHQNIGFQWQDNMNLRMNLNPSRHENWEKNAGVWQLRR